MFVHYYLLTYLLTTHYSDMPFVVCSYKLYCIALHSFTVDSSLSYGCMCCLIVNCCTVLYWQPPGSVMVRTLPCGYDRISSTG